MTFAATVLTLYPEMFPGPLGVSLAGRALERGDWSCEAVQIRDFATDKHRTVDDTPYGGGSGMVMRADVVVAAVEQARARSAGASRALMLTPAGARFDQRAAERSSSSRDGFGGGNFDMSVSELWRRPNTPGGG